MKKLTIILIVVVVIILISYISYEMGISSTLNNNIKSENSINSVGEQTHDTSKNEISNSNTENNNNNQKDEEYIGKEEKESQDSEEKVENKSEESGEKNNNAELTGEEKAVDIVTKEYALNGETVRFDHMEAGDYIVKINNGTAITWYIVDGETWKAEEY